MKKSKLLLVSLILSGLYLVYIVGYFFNGLDNTTDGDEQAGMALAVDMVVPHIVAWPYRGYCLTCWVMR